MALLAGYDIGKAAQAAAYFALKAGGKINVLKLTKLLYLAEREFMARFDTPMFYDKLYSMPDGPVTSVTLNFLQGEIEDDAWSRYVGARQGYDIPIARNDLRDDHLDELSKADREVLEFLWEKFGSWDRYRLRNYTHRKENIPEWVNPEGSSLPITHLDVFKSLDKEDSQGLADEVEAYRQLSKSMADTE